MEAGIQELRGTGMMEWVCLLSPVLQSGSVCRHTFHQHIENYILEKKHKIFESLSDHSSCKATPGKGN